MLASPFFHSRFAGLEAVCSYASIGPPIDALQSAVHDSQEALDRVKAAHLLEFSVALKHKGAASAYDVAYVFWRLRWFRFEVQVSRFLSQFFLGSFTGGLLRLWVLFALCRTGLLVVFDSHGVSLIVRPLSRFGRSSPSSGLWVSSPALGFRKVWVGSAGVSSGHLVGVLTRGFAHDRPCFFSPPFSCPSLWRG